MSVKGDAPRFHHTIRQKTDAEGDPLPIWCWLLQRDNVTVAYGERPSERVALLAAQAAERHYGFSLSIGQPASPY